MKINISISPKTRTLKKTHAQQKALFAIVNPTISRFFLTQYSNKLNQKFIAITTRARPKLNTFDLPIKKRFRGPNKKKSPMETHSPNKNLCDSSTQTDIESNKGKGLSVLIPDKHEALFKTIDDSPTPEYRTNLMKVFNEEFIAENSKKDLGPIIDLVEKQDWLSLKKTNPVFYKIHRALSVTPSGCFYTTTV